MSSKVAAARPLFATATSSTFCRMSELRQFPLTADDAATTLNEAATMAMAAASTTTTAGGGAMSHVRSAAVTTSAHHVPPTVAHVRRKLFGPDKPEDHEENIRFVQQELKQISNEDMQKWNYNFKDDKPLEGKYKWVETSATQVPLAYNEIHLSSTSSGSMTRSLPHTLSSTKSIPAHPNNITNPGSTKTSRALIVKVPSAVKACRNLSFTNTNTGSSNKTNINNNTTDLNSRINLKVTNVNHCSSTIIPTTVINKICNNDIDVPTNIIPSIQRQRLQEKTSTSRQPSISDFMPQRKRRASTNDTSVVSSSSSAPQPSRAVGAEGVNETLDDGYSSEEPSAKKAKNEGRPDQGQ